MGDEESVDAWVDSSESLKRGVDLMESTLRSLENKKRKMTEDANNGLNVRIGDLNDSMLDYFKLVGGIVYVSESDGEDRMDTSTPMGTRSPILGPKSVASAEKMGTQDPFKWLLGAMSELL